MESASVSPSAQFFQALALAPRLGINAVREEVAPLRTSIDSLRDEVSMLRREVSDMRGPKPVAAALELATERPPLPPQGFSPLGAAYAIPSYLTATGFQALNLLNSMGQGSLVLSVSHNTSMLNSAQTGLVDTLAFAGHNDRLVALLPAVGGVAAGMLILKGFHSYCDGAKTGSTRAQILGGLDLAAGYATLASAVPGLQGVGGITALGFLGMRVVATSVLQDKMPAASPAPATR